MTPEVHECSALVVQLELHAFKRARILAAVVNGEPSRGYDAAFVVTTGGAS
jgi:hypothetical protein